jgi:hypothetical protein
LSGSSRRKAPGFPVPATTALIPRSDRERVVADVADGVDRTHSGLSSRNDRRCVAHCTMTERFSLARQELGEILHGFKQHIFVDLYVAAVLI